MSNLYPLPIVYRLPDQDPSEPFIMACKEAMRLFETWRQREIDFDLDGNRDDRHDVVLSPDPTASAEEVPLSPALRGI
jgi:hypothetical protein